MGTKLIDGCGHESELRIEASACTKYDVRRGVNEAEGSQCGKGWLILACRESLLSYLMWLVQRFDSPPRQKLSQEPSCARLHYGHYTSFGGPKHHTFTMSKPAFSFGLKKTAPNNNKPLPGRRKLATFGDDDGDDDSGDDKLAAKSKPVAKAVAISEFKAFDSHPLETPDSDATKQKTNSRSGRAAALAPPAKPKPKDQPSALFGDLSSPLESRKYAEAAEGADPSIYDYDGVYDSLKAASAKKKAEEEQAGAERRPRYFDALQRAADVRERDRQIAEEKKLKREREAEGDAFADKEKFVTEAYKRQQEENRRLEEEEKAREEAEAKKNKNKGLSDFYKQMLEKEEKEHAAMVKAVEEGKGKPLVQGDGVEEERGKSATERAREINAMGGNVIINDDGEVVDKRQLLKGGLNVTAKKRSEVQQDKVRQTARGEGNAGVPTRGIFKAGGKNAMRERQTRMLEAQLEETLKRSREEEEKEQAKVELVAKSRKTTADISSAKERYLARKRAAEEEKRASEVVES